MEIFPIQKKVLELFKETPLKEKFYWTGGTLLSFFYLHHRQSNDLDFFTEKPFNRNQVIKFINLLGKKLKLKHIEEKKIFDRYNFFLHNKKKLRIEFALYEHPALLPRKKWSGIFIDSLDDIAANKTMAFFDRNDPKDLYDIYFLLTKKKYSVKKLLKLTKKKFNIEFSKSAFWSEAFKSLRDLENLKPLFLVKTPKQKQKLIKEIKEYFSDQSNQYLKKKLT